MSLIIRGVVMFALAGCGGTTVAPEVAQVGSPIEWREWNVDVFEQAQREGKLIVVDVGIEGCTACRWMFEDTYQHPGVVQRIRENFIAVAVDANIRPDLGERYARWGWPATIFMAPDGTQVLALRGNKRPRNFIPVLDELLQRQASGDLGPDAEPIAVATLVEEGEFGGLCRAATDRLDGLRTDSTGGWGRFKTIQASLAQHALIRAHAYEEEERLTHVLRTANGFGNMVDPVWGGVFVAAMNPDWTNVIPEKRTRHNAGAMLILSQALHRSGDDDYRTHLAGVHRYMVDWMRSERGTFYATQEDDAPQLPRGMDAREYYQLGDTERRQYGIPPIDHAEYTDLNALVIEAYARWYEATLNAEVLEMATTAADALISERMTEAGFVLQTTPTDPISRDERMRRFERADRAYLGPQGQFGLALLSLYRVTGSPEYLQAATRIAEGLATLEDENGGFHPATPDGTEAMVPRAKPVAENALAARFLYTLSFYTKNEDYKRSADRALGSIAQPNVIRQRGPSVVAEVALALAAATLGPVEFSLVGPRDSQDSTALFQAALRTYEPRKVLHFDTTGRYPAEDVPVMYVCTAEACSSPIRDAAQVAEIAARFAAASDSAPCR